MKLINVAVLLLSVLLTPLGYANTQYPWSIQGITPQIQFSNPYNQAQQLTITAFSSHLVFGDVLSSNNPVSFTCEGDQIVEQVLEPGETKTCKISPHGTAKIFVLNHGKVNRWYAAGVYSFSNLS